MPRLEDPFDEEKRKQESKHPGDRDGWGLQLPVIGDRRKKYSKKSDQQT